MDLRNLNPFQELSRWQDRMSRLIEEGFGDGAISGVAMPAVDVYEKDDKLIIEASLPNFDERDIEVRMRDDGVEIKAKHSEETSDRGRNYIAHEISSGSFYRFIALPPDAKSEEARASYDNGILRVEVPLKERPAAKKLPILRGRNSGSDRTDREGDKR